MSGSNRLRVIAISLTIKLALLFPVSLLACEVCYGKADSPWIDASRASVWLLLGVIVAVQVAFAAFFLNLRSRGIAARRAELESSGQKGAL